MPTARYAKPSLRSHRGSAIAGAALLVVALVLTLAGAWLAVVGGSLYYVIAGVAIGLAGVLVLRRAPEALWLFAAIVLASLVWSLWEAGLDWWPLAARMDVLFVLGLWLLTPWVTRALSGPTAASRVSFRRGGGAALALSLAAFAVVAVASWFHDPHDIAASGDAAPVAATAVAPATAATAAARDVPPGEWHAYGRTGEGQRYSPLTQITPENVSNLQVAWSFQTGDVRGRTGDPKETTFEVTPLKIGNKLILCTPHQAVLALDATSGAVLWRYDPQVQIDGKLALQHLTCRGLSYQPAAEAEGAAQNTPAGTTASPVPVPVAPTAANLAATGATGSAASEATAPAPGACRRKLFMPTADARLLALDLETGAPCKSFGTGGQIDLWTNMPNLKPGAYYSTSPVVVTRKLVIVGGTVLDNVSTREQSGVIRAFDVDTGRLVWNWDSAKPEDTAPIAAGQTYTPNSPNSWSISSVDEALGMVYVPMGNQPPDQWGGQRSEAVETFSSSVVALDLATGKVRWHFQTVHHDLWDYDVPAQPSLVDLDLQGQRVPALVQPTKQGELFVLDRRTGKPLLPVTEVPAPQGAAEGDRTAPTQPRSQLSFDPPPLTARDMWGATMFDQLACRIAFAQHRYEGRFTPPSEQGSIIYPGNFGVFNWGGVAIDPQRQWAFTTPTYLAFTSQLKRRPDATSMIVQGDQPPRGALPALNENFGAPFAAKLQPFLSAIGVPCQAPPWGYVQAVDLRTGKTLWKHRNGTVRDLTPLPLPFEMGVPNLGGPMITGGGVVFLSGTVDYYVRAYDLSNGKVLWKSRLPAGGQATPMSYTGSDGRQYVLVVAGGHGSLGTKAGDGVIAYALPRR